MVILTLALASTGYIVFRHAKGTIRQDEQESLAAITDLKVKQIAAWLNERRADAQAFGQDALLAAEVQHWFDRGEPNDEASRILLIPNCI